MEVQSESNIHFETRDGIWMIEQEKGTGNFQLATAGTWDEYDVSKSYPILYWGQAKSFIQLAKNLWDNGFKFLDQSNDFGPKRRLKFEFRSPYIPKGTLVTCFVAFNGTGVLYRFPDPLNPNDYRQILISGADDRYPHGSVKFSIFHCNNNNNGGGMMMNWNSSININNNNIMINGAYGEEEVYTHYWMKPASNSSNNRGWRRRRRRRKRNEDDLELCYPLDFRLESKFFVKEYPLIIRPINRFYDLRSLYMVELAEKCIFHQSIDHIEEHRKEALIKRDKLKEIFLYYPMLLRFCLWYYTPKCYHESHKHSLLSSNKRNRNNKLNFFTNILASIAQYIPPDSPILSNFPKIRLSNPTTSDFQHLNFIQQWINKIYYPSNHHCSQCRSWYSAQGSNPKSTFKLFSSSSSSPSTASSSQIKKKFNYKKNTAVMKTMEEEKSRHQQESIKNMKDKFDLIKAMPQKPKNKKKSKYGSSPTRTSISNVNDLQQVTRPPQYGGFLSRFFKSSNTSSPSPMTNNLQSTATSSSSSSAAINNNRRYSNSSNPYQDQDQDLDEWVSIENQPYLNQGTVDNVTKNVSANCGADLDNSLDKIYDCSINYDFNMECISQAPNTQQQLQNEDLLRAGAGTSTGRYNRMNDANTNTFYTNSRIEEREKAIMEWDQESEFTNFGLNIANLITSNTNTALINNNNNNNNNKYVNDIDLENEDEIGNSSIIKDIMSTSNFNDVLIADPNKENQKDQKQNQKQKQKQENQKMELTVHGCLSSTYYHIPPNTTVNQCSSEACYFENREFMAQQLVNKLHYYLIGYRWAKRGLRLGFIIGLYLLSRKLWQSDQLWEWVKDECQERLILLCLKGQQLWIEQLEYRQPENSDDLEETLRGIRRKERRLIAFRNQRKRNDLNEDDLERIRRRKRGTTVVTEIKELCSMIFVDNSFRILGQYKDNVIEWYKKYLKNSIMQIRSWNDFLEQAKIILVTLKFQLLNLFYLLKRKWNYQAFIKFMKSLYLIKWFKEKLLFIKTYIHLAINRHPVYVEDY